MKKRWINRAKSFRDAEKFDEEYYAKMTGKERLEILQFLRESYKFKQKKHEGRKRLRRSIRIIQQT
jgi:hypothetical protein